ncbi:serine/threonine protein kinase [Candidatus Uabimicrobium amorphum]|uniref:Serine/threonine protein kinase n=1 Tax=Uabimicrobium amorphum TaxID=2596890 RepID=A0A5S9F4X7_UABAM|nr:serine/threonine-protein kinase [Candidatus Uabimicrobium amorphum]BBM86256.1 serine/threonine protein kinase [Candidatus Uabimicrobium amorphum]
MIIASEITNRRYKILKQISHTDNSEICLCQDERLGTQYALKVLKQTNSQIAIGRFKREIETLYRLTQQQVHNIVNVYDYGIDFGGRKNPWYVMELVEGFSLGDLLKKTQIFAQEDVVYIGIEILKALIHLHQKNIIHRDIKPENIMITQQFKVKLIDFGLAKSEEGQDFTMAGRSLGTPYYQDPFYLYLIESQHRQMTDLYALGATMYTLLCGIPPYKDVYPKCYNTIDLAQRILVDKSLPTNIREINATASEDLANIIQSAIYLNHEDFPEDSPPKGKKNKKKKHQEENPQDAQQRKDRKAKFHLEGRLDHLKIFWGLVPIKISLDSQNKIFPSPKLRQSISSKAVVTNTESQIIVKYYRLYRKLLHFFYSRQKYFASFIELSLTTSMEKLTNFTVEISLDKREQEQLNASSMQLKQDEVIKFISVFQKLYEQLSGSKFPSNKHFLHYISLIPSKDLDKVIVIMLKNALGVS